jgi:hypothetical protein
MHPGIENRITIIDNRKKIMIDDSNTNSLFRNSEFRCYLLFQVRVRITVTCNSTITILKYIIQIIFKHLK